MSIERPQWGQAAENPAALVQMLDQFSDQVINEVAKMCPPGSAMLYGPSTAPTPEGWRDADAEEYKQSKFPDVFKVYQQTFGGNTGTFLMPDTTDMPTASGEFRWIIRV